MAGYFGNEPTCARCDYPRRLHHMLRVEHEYTERPNENAPDAGQGIEGNEPSNQEEGDSDMQSTHTPASYRVLIVAAGLRQIVAHASDFAGAIALINADASRRFGWDAIDYTLNMGDYVRMTTVAGLEVEYRIIPHDQPVPGDEPSAEEIDAFTSLADEQLGDRLRVYAYRYATVDGDTEDVVSFETPTGTSGDATINPDQIPALVDVLLELHRRWLHAGGAA